MYWTPSTSKGRQYKHKAAVKRVGVCSPVCPMVNVRSVTGSCVAAHRPARYSSTRFSSEDRCRLAFSYLVLGVLLLGGR